MNTLPGFAIGVIIVLGMAFIPPDWVQARAIDPKIGYDFNGKEFVQKWKGERPNIIWIVIDTLRYDHLSTSGYERNTSPKIFDLAASSVVFHRAFSAAPWTLPSFVSMLLAKHAFHHNMNQPFVRPGETVNGRMLPLLIRDAGYRTVSIQTNWFSQYFDREFEERYYFGTENVVQDHLAINQSLKWLESGNNSHSTFFMFIGLFSPHWEYQTRNGFLEHFVMDDLYRTQQPVSVLIPGGMPNAIVFQDLSPPMQYLLGWPRSPLGYYQDSRLYIAAYDSEIKYADYQIGRLLDALKNRNLFDDSLIVVVSDHGENMVDHTPYFSHGTNLCNSNVHVPLIIKFPGQNFRLDIRENVRSIDIFPTILDYLSIPAEEMDGGSLIPIVLGIPQNPDDRPVISYLDGNDEFERSISIVCGDYKMICTETTLELYNFREDPAESMNVATFHPAVLETLRDKLSRTYSGLPKVWDQDIHGRYHEFGE